MSEDMNEFLDTYVTEAEDHLQKLNDSLLKLEKNVSDEDAINQIFRSSHTLKSSSSMMGFQQITDLAHEMEDVLGRLRNKELKANEKIVNVLFKCFDALEQMIGSVSQKEKINYNITPLLDVLNKIKEAKPEKIDEVEEISGKELAERPETIKAINLVKVHISKLDRMMNLVGELILNKMRLQNLKEKYSLEELGQSVGQLDRLTEDLQYEVMQARMIPVDQIFNRFPRMIRDLADKENKKINFTIEGSNLELDRSILDEIGEPIVHLLRNSVDHAIETAEERKKIGKTEEGNIKLIAKRERNFAVIEVIDDGRGFDLELIKKTSIKKGFIKPSEADNLPLKKTMQLIFTPGFTTSTKVTEISGRGVGMNVVKTKIERLNGNVEIESEKGKGTKIRLKLPLTLAIIPSLILNVGAENYAIPLANVLRIVKINQENIKTIENFETFILDNENISLVRLNRLFEIPDDDKNELTILIIEKGGEKVGLSITDIAGRQEIIIKPLDPSLKKTKGFAGVTILSSGKAALVLDIGTLI